MYVYDLIFTKKQVNSFCISKPSKIREKNTDVSMYLHYTSN